MKFLYADTQDYVDPGYDFINDRNAPGRKRYWDDRYAHEIMDTPPYDGLLISMSGLNRSINGAGKYTLPEQHRFLRDGARKFLRFGGPKFSNKMLMGDCGAFAYASLEKPPITPVDVFEFYVDAGFTHGCAPDHIIFDFLPENPPRSEVTETVQSRYDVTLENAREFFRLVTREGSRFEPMGPVQGWSPESMADAAVSLEKMGYRYLAVGGLVPLKAEAIHACLQAIRTKVHPDTSLHLLGFAKAEQIHEFVKYRIESFDSTSPLIRAFKDARANYYVDTPAGLKYYSAIRIPQSLENPRLMQAIKRGLYSAEELQVKEAVALEAIRAYDKDQMSFEETLEKLTVYQDFMFGTANESIDSQNRASDKNQQYVARTLHDRPWKECGCAICREIGVEVIIFRSSNRNRRRGFHNLGAFYKHLKRISGEAL